jgi:hypothetical protein
MKYCKTDDNKTFNIIDLNCRPLDFSKTYGIMKDSYEFIKSSLKGTFGYYDWLKRFIEAASYCKILFNKKGEIY